MDYKEKIEPRPATAADSIADGLVEGFLTSTESKVLTYQTGLLE